MASPASLPLKQVYSHNGFTYHNAVSAEIDEIAGMAYQRPEPTPGMAFARKMKRGAVEKDIARDRVLKLFTPEVWPRPLSILTMPGLFWRFERFLLGQRMQAELKGLMPRGSTHIYAVENEAPIFRGSLKWFPGRRGRGFKLLNARTVASHLIREYQYAPVEEYMSCEHSPFVDAAWLDFTGFITETRVKAIEKFWPKIASTLIVTVLNARQENKVTAAMRRHGGLVEWLATRLGSAAIVDDYRYFDAVPIQQVVLRKIRMKEAHA